MEKDVKIKLRYRMSFRSYIMLFAGIVSIIYFILSLLFYWGANVSFLLLGGLLVYWGYHGPKDKGLHFGVRHSKLKSAAIAAAVLALLSFAAVEALIINGALKEDDAEADYVIILGASLHNGKMSKNTVSRLNEAMKYIKENPEVKIIVTGGTASGEPMSEAAAMSGFLLEQGVDKERIIVEDRSTSTYENFKYSKKILRQTDKRSNISLMIITNEFHQYRARLIGKHLGFTVYGQPAATPVHLVPNCYVREYFAVLKTWLFDIFLGWEVG